MKVQFEEICITYKCSYIFYSNFFDGMCVNIFVMIVFLLNCPADLVEKRFSRGDMAQIASDLQARTIHPYANFGADMMMSFQIQSNIWTQTQIR